LISFSLREKIIIDKSEIENINQYKVFITKRLI